VVFVLHLLREDEGVWRVFIDFSHPPTSLQVFAFIAVGVRIGALSAIGKLFLED
jgi:hypothetical protein